MHAYDSRRRSALSAESTRPSDELRIGVTFQRPDGQPGPTKFLAPLSAAAVKRFEPDPLQVDRAIYELGRRGFKLTHRGRVSISVRGTKEQFEKVFGTRLARFDVDPRQGYAVQSFYYPPDGAPWYPAPDVQRVIDDAYIQWPHIYMYTRPRHRGNRGNQATSVARSAAGGKGGPSGTPPDVSYYHLDVPDDLATLLNVKPVHSAGTTGKGVRIAMVDTGFAHTTHPFFTEHGYKSSVDLAPGAISDKTDPNGHGTGESANIFAVAPGATFIGIKVENDYFPWLGASLLEGFQAALEHKPRIISVSIGYDLRKDGKQMAELPNSLAALEAEVAAAVASGVIVVFSAGNGHFSFPGMMPEVVSAGGVYVDKSGKMMASNYASAFDSKIYPGRHAPDLCGLVGMQPHASYLMLPIPPGCEIDRVCASPEDGNGDETASDDAWGVFSGTSAAAPQLAGICALLLEKNPGLTPSDIKAILRRTARDVTEGSASSGSCDPGMPPQKASAGDDGATGAGLVDAFAAWEQV